MDRNCNSREECQPHQIPILELEHILWGWAIAHIFSDIGRNPKINCILCGLWELVKPSRCENGCDPLLNRLVDILSLVDAGPLIRQHRVACRVCTRMFTHLFRLVKEATASSASAYSMCAFVVLPADGERRLWKKKRAESYFRCAMVRYPSFEQT